MITQNHTAKNIGFLCEERSKFFAECERRVVVEGLQGGERLEESLWERRDPSIAKK